MVEGARLESVYRGNSIEGSNPCLSAIQNQQHELIGTLDYHRRHGQHCRPYNSLAAYWKYPLISRIRWLKLVVNAVTSPLAPAGTRAAFATTVPSKELSVDTSGMPPLPHNVRKPRGAGGTTVAFSEYAFAVAGMPHAE